MPLIQTSSLLLRDSLDESHYLESLLSRAEALELTDVAAIKARIQRLCVRQMNTYLAGRSASISESAAQRISESTLYLLSLRLKTVAEPLNALSLLQNKPIDDLFSEGKAIAEKLLRRAELTYALERSRTQKTGNDCFDGTFFSAIPAFFAAYNPEYGAAETHITADYPVLHISRSLRGIEFIADYIAHWQTENRFLRLMKPDFVRKSCAVYAARADLNFSELEENLFLLALAALIPPDENECRRLLAVLNLASSDARNLLFKTLSARKTEWSLIRNSISGAAIF